MSTHHTPGDLQVKIKLPAGLIETRTHDGDDTIVEIEPLDDREASRQAVEKALEELRGNELVIEVPEHSRFGFRGGDAQVRVTVDAPKGAHISTRTASADARLLGELGSIDGVSASGALFAERVAGNVDFKTASGDLSVDGIGRNAKLNTVSGDVRVGSIGGRASVEARLGRRRDRSGRRRRPRRVGLRRRRRARRQPRRDVGQVGLRRHQGRRRRRHEGLAGRQLDERRHHLGSRSVGGAGDQERRVAAGESIVHQRRRADHPCCVRRAGRLIPSRKPATAWS